MSGGSNAAPHARLLLGAAGLTLVVLILTVKTQIYDSNLYVLTEATALLAGDHPYRDFYEVGAPLAAYSAAGVQALVGYRLIGEFARQWLFITAGVAIAFHLGLQLSRSIAASMVMMVLALVILANTPTYHYPKLFFFPLTIWLGWRYIDRPSARRGAALGVTTAAAFLYRHDFGAYVGFASVVAFALARLAVPPARRVRSMLSDATAYGTIVAVLVAPWAIVVQLNEGLVEYTRMRSRLYQPPPAPTYASLWSVNPFRALLPEPEPAPAPGVVSFAWTDAVDERQREQLERQHGLRFLGRDGRRRYRYEVPNLYDASLFALDPVITDASGFAWDQLRQIRSGLPSRERVAVWLRHVVLLIPLLLLGSAGRAAWQHRLRLHSIPTEAWRMILAGAFLAAVNSALIRQPSYFVVVAPVTAALSTRFLAATGLLPRTVALATLALTGFAAAVWASASPLFAPSSLRSSLSDGFTQLVASPPVEGRPEFRYLYDCTRPGDRLLVAGSTPFHVSYYSERPIAGGHLAWHQGWRSDPVHEERSLALLRRQSVPFVVSTTDPPFYEFERYPRIREYIMQHYTEVEGSRGLMLADRRRRPTGWVGPEKRPCFR